MIFRYSNWILLVMSALVSAAVWIRYPSESATAWVVGCVFGLVLGILHLNSYEFLVAMVVSSGGAFVLAIIVAGRITTCERLELLSSLSIPQRIRNLGIKAGAGAAAGAIGALIVSVALKCAAGVRLDVQREVVEAGVGALCGVLFLQMPRQLPNWLQAILGFLIWQIPVGLVLSSSVNLVPLSERSPIFADKFRAFLAGPTIQLIALAGSVASIVSLLRKEHGGHESTHGKGS